MGVVIISNTNFVILLNKKRTIKFLNFTLVKDMTEKNGHKIFPFLTQDTEFKSKLSTGLVTCFDH